jgi:hypothetical protein
MDHRRTLAYVSAVLGPPLYTPAGHVLECVGLSLILWSVLLTIEAVGADLIKKNR